MPASCVSMLRENAVGYHKQDDQMVGLVWYGMVWYGMVWYGMVWYGMVWYGWYGMVVSLARSVRIIYVWSYMYIVRIVSLYIISYRIVSYRIVSYRIVSFVKRSFNSFVSFVQIRSVIYVRFNSFFDHFVSSLRMVYSNSIFCSMLPV